MTDIKIDYSERTYNLAVRRVPWGMLKKSLGRRSIFGILVCCKCDNAESWQPVVTVIWRADPTIGYNYYKRFGVILTIRWLMLIVASYIRNPIVTGKKLPCD